MPNIQVIILNWPPEQIFDGGVVGWVAGASTSRGLDLDDIYVWDTGEGKNGEYTMNWDNITYKHRDPSDWDNEDYSGSSIPGFDKSFRKTFWRDGTNGSVTFYLPTIPSRQGFTKRYKHETYMWWRDWNGSSWENILWYDSVGASRVGSYNTYYHDNQYIEYNYNYDNFIRVFFSVEYTQIPVGTPAPPSPPPPTSQYSLQWIFNGGTPTGSYSIDNNYDHGTTIVWPTTVNKQGNAIDKVYIHNVATANTGAAAGTYEIEYGGNEGVYSDTIIYITWATYNFLWKFNGGTPTGSRVYTPDGLYSTQPLVTVIWPENVIRNGYKIERLEQYWIYFSSRGPLKFGPYNIPIIAFETNSPTFVPYEGANTIVLGVDHNDYKEIRFYWTSVKMKFYKKDKTTLLSYESGLDPYSSSFAQPPLSSIPVEMGWMFDGWYETSSLTNERNFVFTNVYDDVESYSKYIRVKVKLYKNYGINSYDERTLTTNGYISDIPTDSRSRYRFVSWNTESNSDGSTGTNIYSNTRIQQLNSHPDNAEYTFYAIWELITITLYNKNGDNLGSTTINGTTGKFFTTAPTPSVEMGWKFDNWYTTSSGSTVIDLTGTFENTSHLSAYARYTRVVVKFHKNNDKVNGDSFTSRNLDSDGKVSDIPDIDIENDNYEFLRWNSSDDDTGSDFDSTTVLQIVNQEPTSSEYNYYAIWRPIEYKITYEYDITWQVIVRSSGDESAKSFTDVVDYNVESLISEYDSRIDKYKIELESTLCFRKPGVVQTGWEVEYITSTDLIDNQYIYFTDEIKFIHESTNVKVYPIWEITYYTISFAKIPSTFNHYVPGNITYTWNDLQSDVLVLKKKLKHIYIQYKGFCVTGWMTRNEVTVGSGIYKYTPMIIPSHFKNDDDNDAKDVTLYPLWEKIEYKLIKNTYDYNWIHSLLINGYYYYPSTRQINHTVKVGSDDIGNGAIISSTTSTIARNKEKDSVSLIDAYDFFYGVDYSEIENLKQLQNKYKKNSLIELSDVIIVDHQDAVYFIVNSPGDSEIQIPKKSICEILLVGGGGGGGGSSTAITSTVNIYPPDSAPGNDVTYTHSDLDASKKTEKLTITASSDAKKYGEGVYEISWSSHLNGDFYGTKAFNNNTSDGGNGGWHPQSGYVDGWVQIKLPKKIYLSKIKYWGRGGGTNQIPKQCIIKVSSDGINWDTLKTNSVTGSAVTSPVEVNITANSDKYEYYKIEFKQHNGGHAVCVSEIKLYGTQINPMAVDCGGGGGGGTVAHVPGIILDEGTYKVTIGQGGSKDAKGGDTKFWKDGSIFKLAAYGGGAGQSSSTDASLKDGGSGGGACVSLNDGINYGGNDSNPDFYRVTDTNGKLYNSDMTLESMLEKTINTKVGCIIYKNKAGYSLYNDTDQVYYASGGGGAGFASRDISNTPGTGGGGINISIMHSSNVWGGGGGGGNSSDVSASGNDGGGNGGYIDSIADPLKKKGQDGINGYGGGGGGGVDGGDGGRGGDGILVLKIKKEYEIDHSNSYNFERGMIIFENNFFRIIQNVYGQTISNTYVHWYGYFKPKSVKNLALKFDYDGSTVDLWIDDKQIDVGDGALIYIKLEQDIFHKLHIRFQTTSKENKTLNAYFLYTDSNGDVVQNSLRNFGGDCLYHLKNFLDVTSMNTDEIEEDEPIVL